MRWFRRRVRFPIHPRPAVLRIKDGDLLATADNWASSSQVGVDEGGKG